MPVTECDVPTASALSRDLHRKCIFPRFLPRAVTRPELGTCRRFLCLVRTHAPLDEAAADCPQRGGPARRPGSALPSRRNHEARSQRKVRRWRQDRTLADFLHWDDELSRVVTTSTSTSGYRAKSGRWRCRQCRGLDDLHRSQPVRQNYLFFIVPFHRHGVRSLISNAVAAKANMNPCGASPAHLAAPSPITENGPQ